MARITEFRGVGGEIVKKLCDPKSFITLGPLFIFWYTVSNMIGFMGAQMGPIFMLLVFAFFYALLAARFCLPVRQGYFNEGILTTKLEPLDTMMFAWRYMFVLLLACTPLYFLTKLVFKHLQSAVNPLAFMGMGMGMGAPSGPEAVVLQTGPLGLAFTTLLLLWLVTPFFVLLLTASTGSLGETMSLQPVKWVLVTRWADFVAFLTLYVGGVVMIMVMYAIPFLAVAVLAYSAGMKSLGIMVLKMAGWLGFVASPVLAGRLAGAFVYCVDAIGGGEAEELDPAQIVQEVEATLQETLPPEERIKQLVGDPSELLVEWVKSNLPTHKDITSGHLFLMDDEGGNGAALTLGIELKEGAKLSSRQTIPKELGPTLQEVVGEGSETKILFLNEQIRPKVKELGLRVYQRKKPKKPQATQ